MGYCTPEKDYRGIINKHHILIISLRKMEIQSVANAVSAGNMTGAMVNKALTDEHFL